MPTSPLAFIRYISLIFRRNIDFRMMHDRGVAKLATLAFEIAQRLGDRSAARIERASGQQTEWITGDSSQNGKDWMRSPLMGAMAPVTRTSQVLHVHHALPVAEISSIASNASLVHSMALALANAEHRQRLPLARSEPVDDQS
ncbi:hypothetical protein [Sphingobium yanoikuyae]|uniref:hypothetical protein n=1 Tax=Sphingobium yanoikuyae TaxID=13690 RepID=UPI00242ABD24|nr:hypothetical protein [Sphingobium yanoikuyae]